MPYIESFQDFYEQAEALYRQAPLQARAARSPAGAGQSGAA